MCGEPVRCVRKTAVCAENRSGLPSFLISPRTPIRGGLPRSRLRRYDELHQIDRHTVCSRNGSHSVQHDSAGQSKPVEGSVKLEALFFSEAETLLIAALLILLGL